MAFLAKASGFLSRSRARRWSRMDWGKQRRNNPMKTKSGLNFLGYKFSMELMRTEGFVSFDFLIRIFSRVLDHLRQLGGDFRG